MLSKLKKSDNKGFTIIEVMIVLAIAGLILLIVFLAVPALQRSSRNTQRKTDIGSIGSAAQTVSANNGGDVSKVKTGNLTDEVGKLAYYTSANVSVTATIPTANNTTADTVIVVTGAKCGTAVGDAPVASARQMAVLYSSEGQSSPTKLCTDE